MLNVLILQHDFGRLLWSLSERACKFLRWNWIRSQGKVRCICANFPDHLEVDWKHNINNPRIAGLSWIHANMGRNESNLCISFNSQRILTLSFGLPSMNFAQPHSLLGSMALTKAWRRSVPGRLGSSMLPGTRYMSLALRRGRCRSPHSLRSADIGMS